MKPIAEHLISGLSIVVLLSFPGGAYAKPTFAANCADCHDAGGGHMTVSGNDGLANPMGGIGELKRFVAEAGTNLALTINVTNGNSKYNPVVRGVDGTGVTSAANILDGTPDPTWTLRYSGALFTAVSGNSLSWSTTGPRSFSFDLGVPAATPADFYILLLETVGKNGGEWMQSERVYLEVISSTPAVPGDTNNDGIVSLADLAVVQGNFGHNVSGAAFGDFNDDGLVSAADVAILVANYGTQSNGSEITAVPEPSSAVLAGLAVALAAFASVLAVKPSRVGQVKRRRT